MNALAAVAVGEVYGVPDEAIAQGLENLKMTGMRQEILHFGPVTVINDAYNASPASMEAALKTLGDVVKDQGKGRAIAVLADMLELGAHSRSGHTQVGEWCGNTQDVFPAMGRKAGIRRKRQKKPVSLSTMWKIRKRQLQCWNGWSGLMMWCC